VADYTLQVVQPLVILFCQCERRTNGHSPYYGFLGCGAPLRLVVQAA
jgi:hypothetical protein